MPVEESGNLLILLAAIAKMDGNADFAGLYWPQLEQWAAYLKEKGFDPGEPALHRRLRRPPRAQRQSLGQGDLRPRRLRPALRDARRQASRRRVSRSSPRNSPHAGSKEADDGDHFRLAFDKPGTWSQKYNLVWDRVLGLNLFPEAVLAQGNGFLPPDRRTDTACRSTIARPTPSSIGSLWTATLTSNRDDFEALVASGRSLPERNARPLADDRLVSNRERQEGRLYRAAGRRRRLHANALRRRRLAKVGEARPHPAAGYATMPHPPKIADARGGRRYHAGQVALHDRATERRLANRRASTTPSWKEGESGFGTHETPGAHASAPSGTRPISGCGESLICRTRQRIACSSTSTTTKTPRFTSTACSPCVPANYTTDYEQLPIRADSRWPPSSRPSNVLAVHCHQTAGGQYIDVGIVTLEPAEK